MRSTKGSSNEKNIGDGLRRQLSFGEIQKSFIFLVSKYFASLILNDTCGVVSISLKTIGLIFLFG